MTIGERIRYLRKEKMNMTLKDFAKLIGVSLSNLGNMETGKINVTQRNIDTIAEKCGFNPDWIKYGTGEVESNIITEKEISSFMGAALDNNGDTFTKRFIHMLASLEESDWEVLEKMVNMMQKKNSD